MIYLKYISCFTCSRGLCHAYWAPNFWAVYNVVDMVLAVVGRRAGLLSLEQQGTAAMTGGLVQDIQVRDCTVVVLLFVYGRVPIVGGVGGRCEMCCPNAS